MPACIDLKHRGVLSVSGPDARRFLQGLVSNDVNRVSPERAIHAAFLTAQGKYLFDFFIAELDGALLLDCEAERLADFMKRLKLYKLRSSVVLEDASDRFRVLAVTGDGAAEVLDPVPRGGTPDGLVPEAGTAATRSGSVLYIDPRHRGLGARILASPALTLPAGLEKAGLDIYDRTRIPLGVPDGTRDMQVEKTVLLEAGFDELNGVDWQKGCYMGQELTARTKYRGLVKRRLLPVRILDGEMPAPGTPVMRGEREVGEIRSVAADMALAMLRLNALEDPENTALTAGGSTIMPEKPDWATF